MSHHRKSRFSSEKAITEQLVALGQEKEFGPEEVKLLQEYRSIDYGPDALLDRAAAIEAYDLIKPEYPDAILTELGIRFPKDKSRSYDDYYGNTLSSGELRYVTMLVKANKQFLHHWEDLRKKKRDERDRNSKDLTGYMKTVEAFINRAEKREDVRSSDMLATIVQAVQEDGWSMSEKDEVAMENMPLADFVREGIAFLARNAAGDEVDVRVTGNGIYVHVNDAKGNLAACADKSEKLMRRVEALVKKYHGGDVLGGFNITTESSGLGTGAEAERTEDEETQQQQISTDPAKLGRT